MKHFDLGDPFDGHTIWTDQAEAYARFIAADLGVPDFVYRPEQDYQSKPGGKVSTEEVTDGVLMVGRRGLVIESKARELDAGNADTPERAEKKLLDKAATAIRDCNGSLKRLCKPGGMEMTSMRGHTRTIQATADWPKVVILSHPKMPEGIEVPDVPGFFFTTLDDWISLNGVLRSTSLVIDYVKEVVEIGGPRPRLGQELLRYNAYAAVEAKQAKGIASAFPRFPTAPLTGAQYANVEIVNDWMKNAYRETLANSSPDHAAAIAEELDRIPLAMKADLGDHFAAIRERSIGNNEIRHFTVAPAGYLRSIVVVTSAVAGTTEGKRDGFGAKVAVLTATRHRDTRHIPLDTSLGIGALFGSGGTASSPVFVLTNKEASPRISTLVHQEFGMGGTEAFVCPGGISRNDLCPCGSGDKWKRCHLPRLEIAQVERSLRTGNL